MKKMFFFIIMLICLDLQKVNASSDLVVENYESNLLTLISTQLPLSMQGAAHAMLPLIKNGVEFKSARKPLYAQEKERTLFSFLCEYASICQHSTSLPSSSSNTDKHRYAIEGLVLYFKESLFYLRQKDYTLYCEEKSKAERSGSLYFPIQEAIDEIMQDWQDPWFTAPPGFNERPEELGKSAL